ncbi:hypothetical protein [Deinococcus pimensis]|uniref:hypothetical protein n=1 Tax=Deinococcus pimensis TaxID=309888 RepID=UPI0012F9B5FC|nr:hypothetical protein [Deinococcus pimensis]
MTSAHRRHVSLSPEAARFLEEYQHTHDLPNFSATVEAAVEALRRLEIIEGYQAFARDFAADPAMQEEARRWLDIPMDEQ